MKPRYKFVPVILDGGCTGCAFKNTAICLKAPNCYRAGKDYIFKEIPNRPLSTSGSTEPKQV